MDQFDIDAVLEAARLVFVATKSLDKNIELEFRLGSAGNQTDRWSPKAFDPAINRDLFLRALGGLKTNPAWDRVEESTTIDYFSSSGGNLRITHDVGKDSWSAMRKRKMLSRDFLNKEGRLDVRASLATEQSMPMPKTIPECSMIREKKRTSFYYKFWRYDLTEVATRKTADKIDIDDDRAVAFEIEIELTDPARIVDQPLGYVEYVLRYGVMLCQDVIRLSGS
jgi:hypothetical protein